MAFRFLFHTDLSDITDLLSPLAMTKGRICKICGICVTILFSLSLSAQKLMFSQPHGFCDEPFPLTIAVIGNALPEDAVIR